MRIIAGEFRSRKLLSPPDALTTRPIPDRVKESVFGLLRGHMEGASVFDGFAGSGAFGLEAVSRGAARCVFVEKDRGSAGLLRRNIEMLGCEDRCDLVTGDVLGPGALARCPRPATVIFLDPPYPLIRDVAGWRRVTTQFSRLIECLAPDGFGLLRTPWPFVQLVPTAAPTEEEAGEADGNKKRRKDDDKRKKGKGHNKGKSERVRTGKLRDDETEIWSLERDGGHPADRAHDSSLDVSPDRHVCKAIADMTEEELEELDRADLEAMERAADSAKYQRVVPDLAIPGANGPETHTYGTMAVHWYQRAR
ncbi:MAG TPA: RsmD family RNA methyltransferase [Phycisphaerales bacterium]|nr:RsmD family RNA methyltransferase [Phycisphaerales bacterium]